MANFIIYHNPRCSKSRKTLELIREKSIEPEILLYLDNPPSKAELEETLKALDFEPRELLRKTEEDYKKLNLADESKSDSELISAMLNFPKLIERPIVIKGKKAIIGRPPENVYKLINKDK